MQMVFINECKSCDISNIIFNVMFSFLETKEKLVMTQILQNTISHGVYYESKLCLELSQTSMREPFCINS